MIKCSTLLLEETTYISNFWKLDDLLSRISDERIKLQCALDVSYKLTEDQDFIIKKKDKLLDILHFQITLLNSKLDARQLNQPEDCQNCNESKNKVKQLLLRMKVLLIQRRKELHKLFEVK